MEDYYQDQNKFSTYTEVLGFESLTEANDIAGENDFVRSDLEASPRSRMPVAARRRLSSTARSVAEIKKALPPLMSTLDMSGRPRFDLVRKSADGRLMISFARSRLHGVVRKSGGTPRGSLVMEMVIDDGDGDQRRVANVGPVSNSIDDDNAFLEQK